MSYCETTGTSTHIGGCYKIVASCPKIEHTHDGDACWTENSVRKCPYPNEHTHDRVHCFSAVGPLCGGT